MADSIQLAEISKEIADNIIHDSRIKNKMEMLFVAEMIRYQLEQAMVRV